MPTSLQKKKERNKNIYTDYLYMCIHTYSLCIHNINISLERYIRNCKQQVLSR